MQVLRERSRSSAGRIGAVSFVHRFGAALNAHVHFHSCVIDGVFAVGEDGQIRFAEATLTRKTWRRCSSSCARA